MKYEVELTFSYTINLYHINFLCANPIYIFCYQGEIDKSIKYCGGPPSSVILISESEESKSRWRRRRNDLFFSVVLNNLLVLLSGVLGSVLVLRCLSSPIYQLDCDWTVRGLHGRLAVRGKLCVLWKICFLELDITNPC